VFFEWPEEDKDVVQVDETEIESQQNIVHEALKRLGGIGKPKDIKGNSNRPNVVVMAVFCISSGWGGIWF
jgi:hypothetical protein